MDKMLKKLSNLEKKFGFSDDTDNRMPLVELVKVANEQEDESEYWRYWKIFYLRIEHLLTSQNQIDIVCDKVGAPIYLQSEMKNHNYLKKFN